MRSDEKICTGKVPKWSGNLIVPIFKEKGDIQNCGNYRVITYDEDFYIVYIQGPT